MLRDPCEHLWTDLFSIVKRKGVVGPPLSAEGLVGASLTFDGPSDSQERR